MKMEDGPKDWTPIAVAFGTRVSRERERLGLSKEGLADRSGLASRYIWRVEDGRQNITLGGIARIAKGLGLTLAELVEGIEGLVERPEPKARVSPRGPAARRGA